MAKDYQRLWKDVTGTKDEGKAVRTLAEILVDKEGRSFISNLERKDAELCIEILDQGIAGHELKSIEKQAFFVTLRRLAGTHGRLPESMMITEEIEVSEKILASGGFADVRTGKYMGHLVAVKSTKVAELDDLSKSRKQFCKEVVLWSTLSHPNVLKLVGVRGDMNKGQFDTVYEWMVHGNIMEYIRKNPVNRLELLHGAAQGLKYLHDAGLVHGDVKGVNIYISNGNPPCACLADFGFTTMVLDSRQPMSCSAQLEGGTAKFMAPELLVPKRFGRADAVPTRETDIYAFGSVIYQVLTGDIPFPELRMAEISLNVVQGVRPPKPEKASDIGFSDSLWRFVQSCWDGDLELRPKVGRVVSQLERAAADWVGVMPPCPLVENVASASLEQVSASMAHCGIFGQSSGVLPDSPAESQILSQIFDPPSTSSSPHKEEPKGDLPIPYPHIEQRYAPPPKLPSAQKRDAISKRLNLFLFPTFKSPGKAQTGVVSSPPPNQSDQDLIDRADRTLDNTVWDRDRNKLLNNLCKMCSRHRMIPSSMHMVNCLEGELIEECDGGYGKVFRGEHKGRAVAIKVLRLYLNSDLDKSFEKFIREAVTWRHLRHPNILPLLGVNVDLEQHQLAMISEWMVHRNVNEYVKKFEGVNRVQLLVDAANGLEYMHTIHMVHGDLKGANILVNKSHRACLTDFGLSTIVNVNVGHRAATIPFLFSAASKESLMSFTEGGTTRWMSPELLDPDRFKVPDSRPTKQSDCYALGMVVYEVLCGKFPYWEISNEPLVMQAITDGRRPQKPEAMENLGFTDQLWGLVERCWSVDVSARPDVKTVLSHLNHATWSWDRRQFE